jgi:hypothetical protein
MVWLKRLWKKAIEGGNIARTRRAGMWNESTVKYENGIITQTKGGLTLSLSLSHFSCLKTEHQQSVYWTATKKYCLLGNVIIHIIPFRCCCFCHENRMGWMLRELALSIVVGSKLFTELFGVRHFFSIIVVWICCCTFLFYSFTTFFLSFVSLSLTHSVTLSLSLS